MPERNSGEIRSARPDASDDRQTCFIVADDKMINGLVMLGPRRRIGLRCERWVEAFIPRRRLRWPTFHKDV